MIYFTTTPQARVRAKTHARAQKSSANKSTHAAHYLDDPRGAPQAVLMRGRTVAPPRRINASTLFRQIPTVHTVEAFNKRRGGGRGGGVLGCLKRPQGWWKQTYKASSPGKTNTLVPLRELHQCLSHTRRNRCRGRQRRIPGVDILGKIERMLDGFR